MKIGGRAFALIAGLSCSKSYDGFRTFMRFDPLFLDHTFANYLIDSRLNKSSRNLLTIKISVTIVRNEACIVSNVSVKFINSIP